MGHNLIHLLHPVCTQVTSPTADVFAVKKKR